MSIREDFYKFSYEVMPSIVFNNGALLVYRFLRNENMVIENLKRLWEKIKLDTPELRNNPPDFRLQIIQFNVEHSGIILTIPEAMEDQEALYMGIIYDNNDNFRFFTYEIDKKTYDEELYLLIEKTKESQNIIWGTYHSRDKRKFTKELSRVLIYELL